MYKLILDPKGRVLLYASGLSSREFDSLKRFAKRRGVELDIELAKAPDPKQMRHKLTPTLSKEGIKGLIAFIDAELLKEGNKITRGGAVMRCYRLFKSWQTQF